MEGNDSKKKEQEPRYWLWTVGLCVVVIGTVILYGGTGWRWWGIEWASFPLLGDSFGMLNAVFSGLAMGFMVIALWMQRNELKLQRKELSLTRNEMKGQKEALRLQNFETGFSALLDTFRSESNRLINERSSDNQSIYNYYLQSLTGNRMQYFNDYEKKEEEYENSKKESSKSIIGKESFGYVRSTPKRELKRVKEIISNMRTWSNSWARIYLFMFSYIKEAKIKKRVKNSKCYFLKECLTVEQKRFLYLWWRFRGNRDEEVKKGMDIANLYGVFKSSEEYFESSEIREALEFFDKELIREESFRSE